MSDPLPHPEDEPEDRTEDPAGDDWSGDDWSGDDGTGDDGTGDDWTGDDLTGDDLTGDTAAADAAWAAIVANFGDRAVLDDEPPPALPTAATAAWSVEVPAEGAAERHAADEEDPDWGEGHYVPPPPPPATLPRGPRGAAWAGLFGAPAVTLLCLVLGISLPGWAGFLLFVAFLAGFGYLVATMRRHDDSDPWDDGAVV